MANDEKLVVEEEGPVAKEMFDATYEHVDVVKGPAHSMRFIVLKAAETQDPAAAATLTTSTQNLAATGSPKEAAPVENEQPASVKKADDLDPTEPLASADKGDPTDGAEEPGSPAWEAVDAATARKWTAILSRAKNALGVMADRENLEVAVGAGDGDPSDLESAWNLEDASGAIDYAIQVLAPFAVDEQTEVDTQLEAVAKAMVKVSTDDLDIIESLGPVRKAGRVLSASNEAAIRGAVDSLQKVLASLPAAPEDVTKSKEAPAVKDGPTLVVKIKPEVDEEALAEAKTKIRKAKGDPMVAIYDANGSLLGAVDQTDITPLSAGTPVDGTEPKPAPDNADAAPDAASTAEATPAQPGAAEPGAPAAAPAEGEPDAQAVAKAQSPDIAELVRNQVAEAVKAVSEGHEKVVKELGDRLAKVEAQPAPGGPLLSGLARGGLTPKGHVVLRGGDEVTESPEIVRIKKVLEETKDPAAAAQLHRELSFHQMRERLGAEPQKAES